MLAFGSRGEPRQGVARHDLDVTDTRFAKSFLLNSVPGGSRPDMMAAALKLYSVLRKTVCTDKQQIDALRVYRAIRRFTWTGQYFA